MQRKFVIVTIAAVIVVAWIAWKVRVQRGGAAVFRRANEIFARRAPVFVKPLMFDSVCRAATAGDGLAFDAFALGSSATGDEFPVRVRFTYDPPATLPAAWPAGDWCSSLQQRVAGAVARWSSTESADALIADRRNAGERAAGAIGHDLATAGMRAGSVSTQLDLPNGFDRLRAVPSVVAGVQHNRPVVFIGLDGADWEMLDPLMQSGAMPNLKRLVETGAGGILETEHPPLSPIVWTTMMTGVSPLEHQILDFARFNPYTHEKEPITSDERRVPAIWNLVTNAGKQAAVFGLWATYASEPVHGINASDRLFTFLYSEKGRPPGVIWPPSREKWANDTLAAAEGAVDIRRMREYLPSLTDAEYEALLKAEDPYSQPPAALRRILVETEIYRRLSEDYLEKRSRLPDLTIVYLQGTDTIGHVFAPFAPPKQPEVSQADFARYSGTAEHYFRDIDTLLGGYIAIAERNHAMIMIASDHGFHWHEGRPTSISSTATATAAKWHRKEGMYVVWGPGVTARPGHPLHGGIRQTCATLLALCGLPMATGIAPPLQPISASGKSFDYRPYFSRAASPPPPSSNRAANEDLAKLRALGYIGSAESTRSAVESDDTKTAGAYNNEGLILRQQKQVEDALAAFEHALRIDPRYASAMWNESETLFEANRDLDHADQLLISALRGGLADGVRFALARSIAYDRSGHPERSLALLQSAVAAVPSDAELRMFRGRFEMERHDCSAALADFRAAEELQPDNPLAFASAGLAQMCLGDEAGGRESFTRSLRLDPNQPELRRFLGQ